MSDPRAKHWLADDANFLATLGDLDRGLDGTSPGDDIPRDDAENVTTATYQAPLPDPRARVDSSAAAASRATARVIEAARALSAAAPPPAPSAAPIESRPRPLLHLVPERALMPESSASAVMPASPASSPGLDGALIEEAAADLDLQPAADGPGCSAGC